MKEILISAIALVIIPTLLTVVIPLIDRILTDEAIQYINGSIDTIEYFIGSTNTNLLFVCISLCLIIPFVRRILKFFNV